MPLIEVVNTPYTKRRYLNPEYIVCMWEETDISGVPIEWHVSMINGKSYSLSREDFDKLAPKLGGEG